MVKVRHFAEFESDLPTDAILTRDAVIQVGGKTVAEEVGKILAGLGCQVDDPWLQGENGWQFYVRIKRRKLLCQVVHIEKFLLLLEDLSFLDKIFPRPPNQAYLETLTRLAEELEKDARFHGVGWHSEDEILQNTPGAKRPVSED